MGLATISTPDTALDLSRLTNAVNPRVFVVNAKLVGSLAPSEKPYMQRTVIEIKDLTNDPSVVDRETLMKALITKYQFVEVKEAQLVFDQFRVTYEWEGEDLRMQFKKLSDINPTPGIVYVQWHVHVSMAKLMGWLVETEKDKYALGPNLRYEGEYVKNSTGNSIQPANNTEVNRHDLWKVEADLMQLSLTVNWIFFNFNMSFREVVGEPSRTFLVYSDVVDSNVIGGQMHPLVREVENRRLGRGVAYFEPLHIQWLPCRREYKDTLEVQVSKSHGVFVKFGKGCTLVAFVFKRDV